MKIGMDLHGVLDGMLCTKVRSSEKSALWLLFVRQMVHSGHEVHLISGPTRSQIIGELVELNIDSNEFTDIFSVVDYLKDHGAKMWQDPPDSGRWFTDDSVWWATKGEIAKDLELDIMFDDSQQYAEAMPENVKFVLVK